MNPKGKPQLLPTQLLLLQVGGESYYIKQEVITYAGVPHTGCHEMSILATFIWRDKIESEKNKIEPDLKFIVLIKSVYIFVIPQEVRVHGICH